MGDFVALFAEGHATLIMIKLHIIGKE